MKEFLRDYGSFVGPCIGLVLNVVILMIILPLIMRIMKRRAEDRKLIEKKIDEQTEVMMVGLFGGKVQTEPIDNCFTVTFGSAFELITHWNDRASPNIVRPPTPQLGSHLEEVLKMVASRAIFGSPGIRQYFENAEVLDDRGYKYVRVVVGLARPDAHLLDCQDSPRVLLMEYSALSRLMGDEKVLPEDNTDTHRTWLASVREMGENHLAGKRGVILLKIAASAVGK